MKLQTPGRLRLTALVLAIAAATTLAHSQTYTDLYNFDGTHGCDPSTRAFSSRGETAACMEPRHAAALTA